MKVPDLQQSKVYTYYLKNSCIGWSCHGTRGFTWSWSSFGQPSDKLNIPNSYGELTRDDTGAKTTTPGIVLMDINDWNS